MSEDGGRRMIRKTGRIGLGWLEVRNSGLSGKSGYAYIFIPRFCSTIHLPESSCSFKNQCSFSFACLPWPTLLRDW